MARLFSNFDMREVDRRTYQAVVDFSYLDPILGKITAKKSFVTNYASIDVLHNVVLFMFYALLASYGDKAATIHDWLYSGYGITRADGTIYYPTRAECDDVLYRALRAEGLAIWRAWMFWAGVRLGGHAAYEPKQVIFSEVPMIEATLTA